MSGPEPTPAPADPTADRLAAARALMEAQIAVLTRLTATGMGIAEDAGQRAVGDADAGPGAALTYVRAARAVRMSIALQSRLLKDLMAFDKGEDEARASRASVRRQKAMRRVDGVIAEGADAYERGGLSTAAWERLQDLADVDLANRPLGEIVAMICADLGLSPQESAQTLEAMGGGLDAASFYGEEADGDDVFEGDDDSGGDDDDVELAAAPRPGLPAPPRPPPSPA